MKANYNPQNSGKPLKVRINISDLRGEGLSVDKLKSEENFVAYVKLLRSFAKRYTVFIAVSDTPCGPKFTPEMSAELMGIGLEINLVGMFRHSYAAIIDRGELIYERIASSTAVPISYECVIENVPVQLESIGFNTQKNPNASIVIDNKNYSPGFRGLNFVVFDIITKTPIDAVSFDTYSDDITCRRPSTLTDGVLAFKNSHPDIVLLCFKGPKFPDTNLSDNEQFILRNNVKRDTILQNLDKPLFALNEQFKTPEEIVAVLMPPKSYLGIDGIRHFEDTHSQHVNTSGGRRITVDQPSNYKRTVYIVGGCDIFGVGSSDSGTIASHLQRLFNKFIPEQGIIVQNYGFYLVEADNKTNEELAILNSLPVKAGDIVICAFGASDMLPTIDLQNAAKRPHNYGEVFFDQGHRTTNGYRLIADKLFEALQDNDFYNAFLNPPNRSLQAPRIDNNHIGLDNNLRKELDDYKNILLEFYQSMFGIRIGTVVMNCNPFTLGHQYLIKKAAEQVDHLIIFVVQEDKSVFPFDDRLKMVDKGTVGLKNVTVIPSGKFIISSLTFSEYFNKSEIQERTIDSSLDIELFAREIAPCLNISVRFAGEEPYDKVTKQYNDTMRTILPQYNIQFMEIPRKEFDGHPISASLVRQLLEERNFDEISKIVPKTTLEYLMTHF